jgi:ATP phosphoribosyltransferase regulatory subunit
MKLKNLSEKILRSVKSKGFKYIDLPSVIETNHIVQRSGENFRKFIFTFIDQNGSELCLRPDLTIASCLRYLENNLKGKEKIFYSGQAYRKSQNKKDSIIRDQIGFEIIGSKNEKNDDKEIINTALKSLANLQYSTGTLKIGNVEIFNLLISKLDIPKRWKLRLSRHFWREKYFNDLLKRLETNSDVDPTIVEVDKKRYLKMLKGNQQSVVAGRSIQEVLKRFNNKIKDPRRASKGKNVSKIIKEFLKINCPINKAAEKLNTFFKKNKINLIVDQKYFPTSNNKISKLNVEFSASFGRQLEYYTGMVFKIDIKKNSKNINVINGGRYDKLLSTLGGKDLPATGFGFGDMVIMELLAEKGLVPELIGGVDDVVISLSPELRNAAISVATSLRNTGKSVDLVLEDKRLKWAFKHAERSGAQRLVMVMPDEWKVGKVKIKDLESGEEIEVSVDSL